jgi:phosphosulfolactate phosphohydrolase-like enzyme
VVMDPYMHMKEISETEVYRARFKRFSEATEAAEASMSEEQFQKVLIRDETLRDLEVCIREELFKRLIEYQYSLDKYLDKLKTKNSQFDTPDSSIML